MSDRELNEKMAELMGGLWENYDTDIAAAMLVVEKLAEKYYVDIGVDKYGAQVQLNYYTGSEKGWIHGESVRADTLPLAICRAALAATSREQSDRGTEGGR